jgi:crotonobetainyl-CoA:carnitine CoA-transferase CaiB-like acyl-CoA transferase
MFEGVRVLSFTHFLQGPSAVQMLADLGADVIKVEPPKGAFERHWAGLDAFIDGVSVFFMLGNRNQRSLSIDLRAEKAKEIIYRAVRAADVVVENYRPGVMDRLGFGYAKLNEINPRIIYCSYTGYGPDGPCVDRPGQDLLLQSISGLASLNGEKDSAPTPVGAAVVDQHGAVLAAFGIAATLFEREKTGKGRRIESNLLNSALELQVEPFTYYLNKGPLWERSKPGSGSRYHPAPYGIYRTKDSWIAISLTPVEKLRKALDGNTLAGFTERDEIERREDIHQIVCTALQQKTTEEWFSIFAEHGIWHAPVNGYEEVENDPQVAWNKIIMQLEHPDVGPVRLVRHPVRYDGEAPGIRRYPPRLGEHTREILNDFGYTEDEIQRLFTDRIVAGSNAIAEPSPEHSGRKAE